MNLVKITSALALSVAAITAHATSEEEGRPEWKPQKFSEMSPTTFKVVSFLARCSVAYDKSSSDVNTPADFRQFSAKTSKYAYELLEMFAGDQREINGLIKSNQQSVTVKTLPVAVSECNEMFLDTAKK